MADPAAPLRRCRHRPRRRDRPPVWVWVWAAVAALAPAAARAQAFVSEAPPPQQPQSPRPRMSLAIGMGATFDDVGFQPRRTEAIPSFFVVAGAGDGLLGVDFGVFSSAAAGRFRAPDGPVDRLALDGMLVVRPWARAFSAADHRYRARVGRNLGYEAGLGLERDGRGTDTGSRFGLHLGARVELPLGPAGQPSEVRLRLAVRRMVGLYQPLIGDTQVGDSAELYAALAVSF